MTSVTFNGDVTFNGPMFDIHDNEHVHIGVEDGIMSSKCKGEVHVGDRQQPKPQCAVGEELVDSEPWLKVKQAGLVDADGMPTVSRPEAALMAYKLAKLLGIANKWKYFEQLWHRNNMRNDYNTALNQVKSLEFQVRLKKILG